MQAIDNERVLTILSLSDYYANFNNYVHYSIDPEPAFIKPKPILELSP